MARVAEEMNARGMRIPLLVGGAAASLSHTAVRLKPLYEGPLVYAADAGRAAEAMRSLFSHKERAPFLERLSASYDEALARFQEMKAGKPDLSPEAARAGKPRIDFTGFLPPALPAQRVVLLNDLALETIEPYLNGNALVSKWKIRAAKNTDGAAQGTAESVKEAEREKEQVLHDAKALLRAVKDEHTLRTRGVLAFYPCLSEHETIRVYAHDDARAEGAPIAAFTFPRVARKQAEGATYPCLADFVLPAAQKPSGAKADVIGFFALSAAFGLKDAAAALRAANRDYEGAHLAFLAAALTEAFSEYAARSAALAAPDGSRLPVKIRPAFGYPSCPRHEDKRAAFALLDAEARCGFALTETAMIDPPESVCGMYFYHAGAFYV
jgi:5-methyltetrahydrofolate--homocysteine methyltransferase